MVPAVQGTEQGALLTPIRFSGAMAEEQTVSAGVKGQGTRAAGTPLSDKTTDFHVFAIKNMSYDETDGYGDLQYVIVNYHVQYADGSANSSTSNTNGWDYVITAYPDQTIKYWDWDAKAYRFFGAAGAFSGELYNDDTPIADPYSAEAMNATKFKMHASVDVTRPTITPYISRLWFSTGDTSDPLYADKPFGQPVRLEFMQPFSRVRFMYIYTNPEEKPSGPSNPGPPITVPEMPVLEYSDFRPTDPDRDIHLGGNFHLTIPLVGKETKPTWTTSDIFKTLIAFNTPYSEDINYTLKECYEYNAKLDGAISTSTTLTSDQATALNGIAGVSKTTYAADEHPTTEDARLYNATLTGAKTTSDIKTPHNYKWYDVLPTRDQGSFTLQVRVNGDEKTCYVPAQYMNWEPGYSYTYIFKVNGEGGVAFQAVNTAFAQWGLDDNSVQEDRFYNW